MAQVDVDNQIFFPENLCLDGFTASTRKASSSQQTMAMEGSNIVPGAGHINESPAGRFYNLDELVDYAAIYSDNTAANMLIEAVGGGALLLTPMSWWIPIWKVVLPE